MPVLGGSSYVLAHSLQKRRIVLVEHDRAIERSVVQALMRSFPDIDVYGTLDPDEALALLKDDHSRLLIADVRARGTDPIALASAARKHRPSLPVIVIGSTPSEGMLRRARSLGSVAWLERPPRPERLVGLVERLLVVPAGFNGELAVDGLPELVQLLCAAGTSGALHIDHGEERGSIAFEHGSIVDARIGPLAGVLAFRRMMKWTGGVFALDRSARAPQRSIDIPAIQLLLESARMIDEEPREERPAGDADEIYGERRGSEVRLRAVSSSSFPPLPAPASTDDAVRVVAPTQVATPAAPGIFDRGAAPGAELGAAWTTPAQQAADRFERGMKLAQEKRYEEALCEWEAAAALAPENRTYQFNLRRLRELALRRS